MHSPMLYQHDDGRYGVSFGPAQFAAGMPAWHRIPLDVVEQQPIEPHPPTRDCMCTDCAPSFESTVGGQSAAPADAVYEAIDILTTTADEVRECHTLAHSRDDWTSEPEAKAEYDRILRCVAALRAQPAAVAVPAEVFGTLDRLERAGADRNLRNVIADTKDLREFLVAFKVAPAAPQTESREHLARRLIGDVREADTTATSVCRTVAKLPDRNSPEGWPEAMIVTHDELHQIVREAMFAAPAVQAAPTPQQIGDYLADLDAIQREVVERKARALSTAEPQAREGARPVISPYNLNTGEGGRGYIAEFFSKRLRRHDFTRYINERLAADFACVLSQYLATHGEING